MAAETDISPLTYMTTAVDREIVLPLLCSLLNTVSIDRFHSRLSYCGDLLPLSIYVEMY